MGRLSGAPGEPHWRCGQWCCLRWGLAQAIAQPLVPWCSPRVSGRARLMTLARVRMSVNMRADQRQRALRPPQGATAEVTDLAFHHGSMLPVGRLPGRVFLAGFGVLQSGFMEVDADNPPATRLARFRASARCADRPDPSSFLRTT